MDITNLTEQKEAVVDAKAQAVSLATELSEKQKPLDEQIQNLRDAFEKSNAELIQLTENAKERAETADNELRSAILEAFDGENKQLGDGMSVRVNKSFKYDDKDAVEWALEHKMPNLLTINKTKFKKLAAIQEFNFVEQRETISAVVKF